MWDDHSPYRQAPTLNSSSLSLELFIFPASVHIHTFYLIRQASYQTPFSPWSTSRQRASEPYLTPIVSSQNVCIENTPTPDELSQINTRWLEARLLKHIPSQWMFTLLGYHGYHRMTIPGKPVSIQHKLVQEFSTAFINLVLYFEVNVLHMSHVPQLKKELAQGLCILRSVG